MDDDADRVDRVEALPFRVPRQATDLLSEARRQYEKGNYNEAIVYLFSHQLVELDRQHLIHLARGKTNRQLVRELVRAASCGCWSSRRWSPSRTCSSAITR